MLRPHGSPTLTALITVAAIALSVSACSGDDEPDPTTVPTAATSASTAPPPTTTSPTSTTAAQSTTQPPGTTAPSSTTPTTSAPTTPPTAPTDTQPRTTLETTDPDTLAMVDALYDHIAAFERAMRDPTNAALEAEAVATTTGAMTATVTDTLAGLRERSQATRPNPIAASRQDVIEFSITVADDLGALDACWVSADRVVTVDPATGTETPFNSEINSYNVSYSFTRIDGRWLVSLLDIFDKYEGQQGCE